MNAVQLSEEDNTESATLVGKRRPSWIFRFGSFNGFIRLISSVVLPIEMADHEQYVYMAKLAEQAERYDGL